MKRGKQTCRILKEIRRQIAEVNDIEFITSECQYQGDCLGTCPKCEAEVRYLEQQLERKRMAGKAITILGISAGVMTMNAQNSNIDSTQKQSPTDIIEIISTEASGTNNTDSLSVIKGIVTDCMRNPITGVLIIEKGTKNGTVTDEFGNFTLRVSEKHPLIVQSIGFQSQEIEIQKTAYIQVVLQKDSTLMMGEILVVNTKKKSQKKKILTTCVSETMPEFPGGNTALMSFIQQNIQYPDPDICITGKVIIQFIISTDGNITNAKIVRGVHPKFDKEALRVVKLMPKWKPGTQKGKPVAMEYTIPVSFRYQ
ncbi:MULTISPECIES: energy transducer TonB [Bacteroides]|jgi:TonB family protein|uniref:energy transducer TonB n=1 Tax=Bacteroides TaxID=816 RepID=UPI00036E2DFB|nr:MULTISPECIES: energy transducer TonB [Bacteroides]EOA57197.1 periplasmic protein TonB [Bacteroides sp. HPS0048]MCQ4913500.1 TonB family protein [Bacteroides nordii]